MHKAQGHEVVLHRGIVTEAVSPPPDRVLITSLFTYSWKPVHEAAAALRSRYPSSNIELGGIYATLMPEHAKLADVDTVRAGLVEEAEDFLPDYSLVPEWDSSILFATRGCVRKCAFCAVPKLEGKISGPGRLVAPLVDGKHRKAVLWDNNILGVPNWRDIVEELRGLNLEVDFNQGLDARFITPEVAQELSKIRIRPIRMAYDIPNERKALERAIPALVDAGFSRSHIHVYTLYNFTDTPDDFLARVIDLLGWGVVSFPMRYEPLNSLTKNKYISPHWTAQQLELVARARQVMGSAGAFPPRKRLLAKLRDARSFEEAFGLEGGQRRPDKRPLAGTLEAATLGLTPPKDSFRELLNDPSRLLQVGRCNTCAACLPVGSAAFGVQDYAGKYVAYVCARCHPNRRWIHGLWRSALDVDLHSEDLPIVSRSDSVLSRTVH